MADALPRRDEATDQLHALSGPSFDLFDNLRRKLDKDTAMRALRDSIAADRGAPWRVVDGLILHGTRVFVPVQSALLPIVLELAHSVGHEGVQKTLHRLRAQFYVEGDRAHVRDYVHACAICQKNNVDSLRPAGLL